MRNGSVIDLQVEAGRVRASVSGSDIYQVDVKIKPLAKKRWTEIKGQCAAQIDSLVELLQGSISKAVMESVTRKGEGLFPSPREITLSCSCPDWATMCKHVAATLYGVGARLDHEPELLFTLRGVDPTEMVEAAVDQPPTTGKTRKGRMLESDELSSVFGVDIDMGEASSVDDQAPAKRTKRAARSTKASASQARKKKTTASSGARKPATKKPAGRSGAKKLAPKQATVRTSLTKKASTKKAAPKKTTTKKTTPKKPTTKRTVSQRKTDKKSTAKRTAATNTASRNRKSAKKPAAKSSRKKASEATA